MFAHANELLADRPAFTMFTVLTICGAVAGCASAGPHLAGADDDRWPNSFPRARRHLAAQSVSARRDAVRRLSVPGGTPPS